MNRGKNLDMIYCDGGTVEYVWEFLYCSDLFESASHTMSIHKTCRGAYNAMKAHRLAEYWRWRSHTRETRREVPDTSWQSWKVRKTIVKV